MSTSDTSAAADSKVATFNDSADAARSVALAVFATDPNTGAAAVVAAHAKTFGCGVDELNALAQQLDLRADKLRAGDTQLADEMLLSQASALHAMFVDLATRAARQDMLNHCETLMRMALKSQNQCRATLETLSSIRNPPLVIARQANINNGGQQQVNNGLVAASGRGDEEKPPNELLEKCSGYVLDSGAAATASRGDPQMATVGTVHGAAQRRRQGTGRTESLPRRPARKGAQAGASGSTGAQSA
jgi:hypothetical protein